MGLCVGTYPVQWRAVFLLIMQEETHAPRPARRRIVAVEVLRLIAILGVAVFHTFMWHFQHAATCLPPGERAAALAGTLTMPGAVAVCGVDAPLAVSPAAMWPIGMMMLLGSWANHVFFMISGFFLIPAAARRAGRSGYWRAELRATARRVAFMLATVVFYWLLLWLVNRVVLPVPAMASLSSWVYGLQFVWLYILFVAVAPCAGWLMGRLLACRHGVAVLANVCVVAVAGVTAANLDIMVTSVTYAMDFALGDWRKMMSGVTYVTSFLLAGALGIAVRRGAARRGEMQGDVARHGVSQHGEMQGNVVQGGALQRDAARQAWWSSRRWWLAALMTSIALSAVLYAVAVLRPTQTLLTALSFKSTSPLSFLLALTAVMTAATGRTTRAQSSDDALPEPLAVRGVTALAAGTLGFYIVQSITGDVWRPLFDRLLNPLLTGTAGHTLGSAAWAWGMVRWYLAGLALSVVLVVMLCAFDRWVRRPLLKLIHLAK